MWSGAEVRTVGGAIRVLGAFAGSVPSPRQFSIARQVGVWDRRGADSADRDASIRRLSTYWSAVRSRAAQRDRDRHFVRRPSVTTATTSPRLQLGAGRPRLGSGVRV